MIDQGVRAQFPAAAGYLDTASLGLPPQATVTAISAALAEWQAGTATAPGYDRYVDVARASFAEMVGVPAAQGQAFLEAIQCPGLLLVATGGVAPHMAELEHLADLPWLQIEEVEGSHHCHMEAQAQGMAARIVEFLGLLPA